MKLRKLFTVLAVCALAVACCFGLFACGEQPKTIEAGWSAKVYKDGYNQDSCESYRLTVDGTNYELAISKGTLTDYIDMTFHGALFGTYTVTEKDDNLVYTLNTATRGVYANGKISAVVVDMDPVIYDTDDQTTWPDSLDGENDTTQEAVFKSVYGVFGLEAPGALTVTVRKADCYIMSVEAAA